MAIQPWLQFTLVAVRLACHVAVQARADAQGVISKENFKVFLLKAVGFPVDAI